MRVVSGQKNDRFLSILADITVVKSMKNPPAAVKMVLEAICVMRGIKPEKKMDANGRPFEDYWAGKVRLG